MAASVVHGSGFLSRINVEWWLEMEAEGGVLPHRAWALLSTEYEDYGVNWVLEIRNLGLLGLLPFRALLRFPAHLEFLKSQHLWIPISPSTPTTTPSLKIDYKTPSGPIPSPQNPTFTSKFITNSGRVRVPLHFGVLGGVGGDMVRLKIFT